MKVNRTSWNFQNGRLFLAAFAVAACAVTAMPAFSQSAKGPVRITLDEAIRMAIQHNHGLIAARTTISQSQAQEITANLRPNPEFFADWDYLPVFSPSNLNGPFLRDSTEIDTGLSYLIERGKKRQHRLQAAKDTTAMTRSQVEDDERTLSFQVASLFINVQLAESTLDLARQNLKSFQDTVDISESQFRAGGISENDYLKIKLQLLQFQTDVQQAQLARVQALSDLRQLLGYESVSPDYDVAGSFEYQPLKVNLEDLQMKARQNRPDLRAAREGVTSANSQHALAKANGKKDVTVQGNYSHNGGLNVMSFLVSVPLSIFDRNQGEIARTGFAITQAQEQEWAVSGQVMTDLKDAYENLQTNDQLVQLYRSSYLDVSKQAREISEFAYRRGAVSLLDFLDAERSYRATQLAYRQALASLLLAVEQLHEAVGTRNLP